MHPETREMYEMRFKLRVYESKGDVYQSLFSDVMQRAHPEDFMKTRPWGNLGDKKNDGFLKSERHLYQVYAPNEMTAAQAIKKIEEDFLGALPHWGSDFDKWSFVHNAFDGLGPHIQQTILALEKQHHPIKLTPFSPIDLSKKLFSLDEDDIMAVLGLPYKPTRPSQITFEEIKHVLEQLAHSLPEQPAHIQEVPPGKLNANSLSSNSRNLVRMGMGLAPRVGDFFGTHRFDPELGNRVAQVLREEYIRLKGSRIGPDAIYSALFNLIRQHQHSSEAAALAILAYFFERCDIFEPLSSTPSLQEAEA
ncbi:ABC-three component system protein [Hymenobacter sublimis]|uniref:ABC-three component systems C-terminal domain-containing protein n=1 Tax=Hymenobacter sublimis TaxID=2933777 RepID=A0ABY4JHN9_9BACT|nr:ABC-three component system protein [Hymenobacter sublimis]UPL51266.1 hypothetical protein MWH26_19655 [Hymenobacter sublimis]